MVRPFVFPFVPLFFCPRPPFAVCLLNSALTRRYGSSQCHLLAYAHHPITTMAGHWCYSMTKTKVWKPWVKLSLSSGQLWNRVVKTGTSKPCSLWMCLVLSLHTMFAVFILTRVKAWLTFDILMFSLTHSYYTLLKYPQHMNRYVHPKKDQRNISLDGGRG